MSRTPYSESHEYLRSLISSSGKSRTFSELLEYGKLIAELHQWCTTSLSERHLVEVAASLKAELTISGNEMDQLGIPVDLLPCFPDWEKGSREGFSPPPSRFHLPKIGAAKKLCFLRLQLSPFSPTLSAALLLIRRLIETLDETVRFSIAVEPGGNLEALHQIISEFGENVGERVSLVELQTTSVFAQDNARGARSQHDTPLLLVPRGFRQERERAREALHHQLTPQNFELPIGYSSLYWEGGNIVNDTHGCFIGVDHIRENMVRLGLTKDEVIALFQSEFGEHIEFMGSFEDTDYHPGDFRPYSSGQASFHIDLDLHVLGQLDKNEPPVALLASPEIGLQFSESILSLRKLVHDHFLTEEHAREHISFEYHSYAEERHERLKTYRKALETRGYRVVEVPDLRIDPRDNLFSTRNLDFIYCNVLSGNHRGSPTIFYLPYAVDQLDKRAEQSYREAGCNVVKVSQTGRLANLLMLFNGGLRCACSQIY
ncbi:MAG: hypothetical protein KDD55_05940 [Bdellovibrionales bacterium]|nr:hypothetical protein [Bdellovibrionales bacterium]